jgi:bifunctional DNA-binding transcriptional regulator/antitoxin component of YhaV-PrlF toxin-antitoxin module
MKTTLNADGQIGIPQQIRDADHLAPGDSFELERLTPGHYLLAKQSRPVGSARFTVATGDDGLPVIRVADGAITSRLVKEIESQTP